MNSKKKRDLTTEFVDLLLDDQQEVATVSATAPKPQEKATEKKFESPTVIKEPTKIKEGTAMSPFRPHGEHSEIIHQEPTDHGFEANISRSEHLRMAQEKILELEDEVERLRVENEQLSASNQAMKTSNEDLVTKLVQLERKLRESQDAFNEEKNLLKASNTGKDKEIVTLKLKIEELESRLLGDLKKIRVRERELENRLELVKMEGAAVIRSKDEMILDLKRQVDQLANEMETYKMRGQELSREIDDGQDRVRRAVKALRLALSMLDGEEGVPLKKVE